MEKNKKELRNWGTFLLVFAICDAMTAGGSLLSIGDVIDAITAQGDPAVVKVIMIIGGVVLAVGAIMLMLQAFIGFRGMQISKNPTDAAGHIRIAKILIVLHVLIAISLAIGLTNTTPSLWNYLDLVVSIANAAIMFFYAKSATAVREDFRKGMNG